MPRNKAGMASYPLYLPEELKKVMEALAEKHHRSLNGEINEALVWWTKFESVTAADLDRLHAPNAGMSGEQLARLLASRSPDLVAAESTARYGESVGGVPITGHGYEKASPTGLESKEKDRKAN